MKKIFVSLLLIITIFSTLCVFATENEINIDEEALLEKLQNTESVYKSAENYTEEDIEKEYQQMLKEMYEESLKENQDMYKNYEAEDGTKAKVIEAGKTEYTYDTDYTNVYKCKIQNIRVEVLEGEHVGKEFDVEYQLSNDSLLNLEMPKVKTGDIIYVDIYNNEKGEQYAVGNMAATMIGANLERKIGVVIIAVIAITLVCVFGKEKGIISILIAALMLVLMLLIFSEQIFLGTKIESLSLILSVIIVVILCIQKEGLTEDAFSTSVISTLILLLAMGITYIVDALLRSYGGTFDTMFLVECILNQNINLHDMFIASVALILSGILPYVVCNVWAECKNSKDKSLKALLDASKNAMSGKIEILTMILMVLAVPKLVFLYCSKYFTMNMILNSEILITEMIRFFVCLISISIVIPITTFIYKYIKS